MRRQMAGLLVALGMLASCGQPPMASPRPPAATPPVTGDAAPPPSPAETVDAATPPTEAADAEPAGPHTCVVPYGLEVSEIAHRGNRFVDGESVCTSIELAVESIMGYRANARTLPQGTASYRDALQQRDPAIQVSAVFGYEPVAVYRNRAELSANAEIPSDLVPKNFDFSKQMLVQLWFGHSSLSYCADGESGQAPEESRARREYLEKWQARAAALKSKWLYLGTRKTVAIAKSAVVPVEILWRRGFKVQGPCSTHHIWQPALVAVPATGAPIRIARP